MTDCIHPANCHSSIIHLSREAEKISQAPIGNHLWVLVLQAAELKELKEFTTKLKSLPQIQRHIELLSAIQTVSGQTAFRERVSMEQAILDAGAVEQACLFAEVFNRKLNPSILYRIHPV